VCYSFDFGRVLYFKLLCVIPSILAVFCFCCVLYLLFCYGLFPQFCLCAIFAVDNSLNFAVCYICGVLFSPSVLARACTRARLCAVFAIPFLLYAIPSILTVCCFCFMLCPQFWPCAIFAVFYSLNFGCGRYSLHACVLFPQFGCVLYLLCTIPSISAVCGCFCCGLFPQFWLYAIFAILRTPYILYCLRRVSRVCLPGGVQLVVAVSLALRKCVRKKSYPMQS
jgi:hypothetical protein